MPCFHPLDARRSPGGQIAMKAMTPFDKLIKLPCGRCRGCKLERSRQWAVRLMHEAQLHQRTSFLTLTYHDLYLPIAGATSSQSLTVAPAASPRLPYAIDRRAHAETHAHDSLRTATLAPQHLRAFTHRLNSHVRRRFGNGVKYYACGEYGDRTHRPHYHLAVFGEDFRVDRVLYKHAKNGDPIYESKTLARLWTYGHATIGELTFESAAYVARYIMKKITGDLAHDHYRRQDAEGNDCWIEPEFNRVSNGIGKEWITRHRTSVYPHDRVIVRNREAKPPRYYDKYLESIDPDALEAIKAARQAAQNPESQTPERLRAGEAILDAQLKQRNRPLEK